MSTDNSLQRVEQIRAQLPSSGMFGRDGWRISPTAFPLTPKQMDELEKLGPRLLAFQKACNLLYRQSVQGKMPSWIAEWLDLGKPPELVEISRNAAFKNNIPDVIRPDLILTDQGWIIAEIDSVPGGIGVTSWLNKTYTELGEDVVGGPEALGDGIRKLIGEGEVVIAEEALDYRPEWEYLLGADRVKAAETYRFNGKPVYRFFEAFDWANLPTIRESWSDAVRMTPPLKPYLEEKMWLALFWIKPLREFWRRELGDGYRRDLEAIIPESWVVNPEPLPPTAVLPGLNVNSWDEVAKFSQKERELILKVSGFSPQAWGSRGVVVGSDVSTDEWTAAIKEALEGFGTSPRIMQRFGKGRRVQHPYFDDASREIKLMNARVRLTPYYLVEEGKAVLKGAMATICPDDKKLIHGMRDAIMVPCRVEAPVQGI